MSWSKIDFTKCKLEPLPCLMANGTTKQLRVFAQWDAPHRNVVLKVGEPGSVVLAKTGHGSTGWQFMEGSILLTTDDACLLIDRAEQVNRFIAAETARIEAEEEQANWVMVPWMDVEWLIEQKAKVRDYSADGERWADLCSAPNSYNNQYYHAYRRTFPAGYDPTKPRWVEVETDSDWERLTAAGAHGTRRPSECKVDIHTIPHGVPLHVEPKPEPRPCTKEFALSHPNESEFRCRWQWVEGSEWSNYCPMSKFHNEKQMDEEFRTTAKEETTLDLGPFPDVTIDVNEEVSQALAIHLLKSRRVAIVDLETGQRFMVTPGPLVKSGA